MEYSSKTDLRTEVEYKLEQNYFGVEKVIRPLFESLSSMEARGRFVLLASQVGAVHDYKFVANVANNTAVATFVPESRELRSLLFQVAANLAYKDNNYWAAIGLAIEGNSIIQAASYAKNLGGEFYLQILKSDTAILSRNCTIQREGALRPLIVSQADDLNYLIARYYDCQGKFKKAARYLSLSKYLERVGYFDLPFSQDTMEILNLSEFEKFRNKWNSYQQYPKNRSISHAIGELVSEGKKKATLAISETRINEAVEYLALVDRGAAIDLVREFLSVPITDPICYQELYKQGTALLKRELDHLNSQFYNDIECSRREIKKLLRTAKYLRQDSTLREYFSKLSPVPFDFYVNFARGNDVAAIDAIDKLLSEFNNEKHRDDFATAYLLAVEHKKYLQAFSILLLRKDNIAYTEKWQSVVSLDDAVEICTKYEFSVSGQPAFVADVFWESVFQKRDDLAAKLLEQERIYCHSATFMRLVPLFEKSEFKDESAKKKLSNELSRTFLGAKKMGLLID